MTDSFRPMSGYFQGKQVGSYPLAKIRLENEIVRKREAENRRTETWKSNDKYFHFWNIQNEKFDDWTSPRSTQLSYRQCKVAEEEAKIEKRRECLQQVYAEDKSKYEYELQQLNKKEETEKWERIRKKVEDYRYGKEVKWKEMAEKYEHDKWRANSHQLKDFQTELAKQHQKLVWDLQKNEKEQEKKKLEEEKKNEMEKLETLGLKHIEEEQYKKKLDMERKIELRKELEKQMEILRIKEKEEEDKRRERERLIAEREAVEALNDEIHNKELQQIKKLKMKEFWTKQHQAKLRQRSQEIASELENEEKMASALFAVDGRLGLKEQRRQEILKMQQLIEHHKQLERERLQQTELLFQEEARRMWEKREKEWEMERMARKKLMDTVIQSQKKQIEEKLKLVTVEREALLKERSEIMDVVDKYNRELKESQLIDKAKKMEMKNALEYQIQLKKRTKTEEEVRDQQEMVRRKQQEMDNDAKHWAIEMERLKL